MRLQNKSIIVTGSTTGIGEAMARRFVAEGARVLIHGSINGYCGEANQLAYSLSKGALITFSRNLADAFGRDRVRVNHMNLGWVLSPNEYKLKVSEGLPEDWPDHPPAAFAPSGH